MRGVVEGVRRRVQEIRWTGRALARTPWFSAVVVLVAGLGIGANTAIFSALSVLVLRPLPIEAPDEMVDVLAVVPGGNSFTGFSFADWRDLADGAPALTGLAAYTAVRAPLGTDPLAPPVTVQLTSADYFALLGVRAHLGTVRFDPTAGFGADPSAILSHATWERAFGGDPGVVGRSVTLEGRAFTVVGVAPQGFSGHFIGFPVDAWVPLSMIDVFRPGSDPTSRADKPLELIGRRRPEATVAQIQASLTRVAVDLDRRHPETNAGLRVEVTSTTGIDHSLRSGVFGILAVFGAVAALVLLIACANIGGLLLARAVTRRQEIAVRSSLGASRGRLVWDAVREGLLLFGAGSLLAFGLSVWLTGRLERFLAGFRLGVDLPVDLPVLAFTIALGLLTSLVATAAPALYGTGRAPASLLGRGGGGGVGPKRARWAFVVVQVALATSLLVGAGLFTRSVRHGLRADLGLAADDVVVGRLALPGERYDAQSGPAWRDALARQLTGAPTIAAVTWA
ncbi:MAG: ABC transporter permease, partial [Gemmatimonadetes bacterium]|nr:ABC transporter permease [Gemmatimonadota bacterium]